MTVRLYPAYPQQLYLPTNSTQASFTLTAGRKAVTDWYIAGSTTHRVIDLCGGRGAAFQFFGTDADNETLAAVKIWAATYGYADGATSPISGKTPDFIDLNLFGTTGVVTLSTATGAGTGDLVPSTSFIADTIASWAVGSLGTTLEATYGLGTSDEYSPAGNVPATLIVPSFGHLVHGFVVEFDLNTAASANALYTLTA